jgi:Domain of unknown function (DUF4349)
MSAIDRSELDGYEALVSELRAAAPVAPESLRQRVLEGAPAPRRRRSRKQRLLLVVVPAAVVLAVGAALVHGFVSTGSRRPDGANLAALAAGKAAVNSARPTPTSVAPARRTVHSATHKQPAFYSAEGAPATTVAQGLALTGSGKALDQAATNSITIPKHRLVHAVASLEVSVHRSQLSAKTNLASQIVGSFGGYAQSVRFQASRQGYGEAFLALRVPVQKAQAAMAKLSTLGRLLSQEVSTQDLQSKLTHQNSGIGSLRRAITVYETALRSSTLSASDRVGIEIRLSNARHALARLRHARNGTLASGATADISLLLTTRSHAIVVPHHHHKGRFGRLLGSAAGFLGLEGIIVLYALVVLSPVLVLGGLGWLLLRERRRREERLLASA